MTDAEHSGAVGARRHPNVVNIDEVKPDAIAQGEKFGARDYRLAFHAKGRGLGCSYYEVEPGKRAFPFHYHCANEEALFIIDGEGTVRIGGEQVAVRAGDYVAHVVGPEHAHQLINTGTRTLKYLAMSTMIPVEVVGYPDSKKLAASAAASVEEAFSGRRWVRHLWKEAPPAGYYDGEEES